MVHSAGILAYRYTAERLEVMLAHPGGPFWAKKDDAAWSIPKGVVESGESIREAAVREFKEEIGELAENGLVELGTIKQSGQKAITAFAVCKDIDVSKIKSNTFEMEWPPKSGKTQEFPENDRAQWFPVEHARKKIFKGQMGFIDNLIALLNYVEPKTREDDQQEVQLSLFN